MPSERMREHAQDVLGVPVVFNALLAWDNVPQLPSTRRRTRTSTAVNKLCAAMLMPAGGELFSVYVDQRKGMFVQAQDDVDALYILDKRWGALCDVLPPDSSCLAVVYRNNVGQLVLGMYDVLRVAGSDRSVLSVFERQGLLCDLFKTAPRTPGIERHWVGLEASLLKYIQVPQNLREVPFEVAHMLRLSDTSVAACRGAVCEYEVVLMPLTVPNVSLGPVLACT
jgi:hypothetical protein